MGRGRPKIYDDASEDRVTLRINARLRGKVERAAAAAGQSANFWIAKLIEMHFEREAEKKARG